MPVINPDDDKKLLQKIKRLHEYNKNTYEMNSFLEYKHSIDFCWQKRLPAYIDAYEQQQGLIERLKQEAQIQAQEARTHESVVHKIYQYITGNTGEPGNWNGAKPVIEYIEQQQAEIERLRKIAAKYEEIIMCVQNKVPDQSRHDRAIAIIKQHESFSSSAREALQTGGGDVEG